MAPKVLSVSTGLLFLKEIFHAMIWKGDSFAEMLQDFYLSREKTIILFVTYCQKFSKIMELLISGAFPHNNS